MTEGQKLALFQLKEIDQATENLISVESNKELLELEYLAINFSINCRSFKTSDEGLSYRERESFILFIHPDFPFKMPSIFTTHTRFANFPHVQWGRSICLYLAPDSQWNPSEGVSGVVKRLLKWLEKAALNELDPIDAPLHPPITYTNIGKTHNVVIQENAPEINGENWFGFAEIDIKNEERYDVIGWESKSMIRPSAEYVGAVLLLKDKMPFEFPTKIEDLFSILFKNDISLDSVLTTLQFAAKKNKDGLPLIFFIGTPMRRSKEGETKIHLTAWYLNPQIASYLKQSLGKYSFDQGLIKKAKESLDKIIKEWTENSEINWCNVIENRSEVTVRRDENTPMEVFRNLKVEIWGCGALGASIALSLVRAGVQSLKIIDNGVVTPGLLVRQPYFDDDIGKPKVKALKEQLKSINPDQEIEVDNGDVLQTALKDNMINSDAQVIIDCSASNIVRYKLEYCRKEMEVKSPKIFSMMIDSSAERIAMTYSSEDYSGGVSDLYRKAKIELSKQPRLKGILESFFSSKSDQELFQPEPGCSSPTFKASAADVTALSNSVLNFISQILKSDMNNEGGALFMTQNVLESNSIVNSLEHFQFEQDFIQIDPIQGFEIRYSPNAIRDIYGHINQNKRRGYPKSETGGILWGEIDSMQKIIWLTEVTGPPPDSKLSPSEFICGIKGVLEMKLSKKENSMNSVSYLGIWHTHPISEALPSRKDYKAIYNLLSESSLSSKEVFISIISLRNDEPEMGSFVFDKTNFMEVYENNIR